MDPITLLLLTKLASLIGLGKAILIIKLILAGKMSVATIAAVKMAILHGSLTELFSALQTALEDPEIASDLTKSEQGERQEMLAAGPDGFDPDGDSDFSEPVDSDGDVLFGQYISPNFQSTPLLKCSRWQLKTSNQ